MRYLVIQPNPDYYLHTVKVIKSLLQLDLRDAKGGVDNPPFKLDEIAYNIPLIGRVLREQAVPFRMLDGPPKRVTGCCICGTDTVREWMSYEMFGDPEEAERFGGQPFCSRCWKTVTFEKFVATVEPPTAWERLGGVWDDEP